MSNTVAKLSDYRAEREVRVADLDDGYTRIANDLLDAVMSHDLTQYQLLIFMAVMRKTYGYNKKMDWISNKQLEEMTGILSHKCSATKNELIKMCVFVANGRQIGINKNISEWLSREKKKVYQKKVNLPESGKKRLPKSGKDNYPNQVTTKDNITKDNKYNSLSENSSEFSNLEKPDCVISSKGGQKWGTADDLKAAKWIFSKILAINHNTKPPNLCTWANDIRLMRQRDNLTHHEICDLFRWANADSFWCSNVLSPAKLRDKWDQLVIQRQTRKSSNSTAIDYDSREWAKDLL